MINSNFDPVIQLAEEKEVDISFRFNPKYECWDGRLTTRLKDRHKSFANKNANVLSKHMTQWLKNYKKGK